MKHRASCKTFLAIRLINLMRPSVMALGLFMVISVVGCAGLIPDLVANEEVTLERIDSRSAHVRQVRVWAEGSALKVSGTLSRLYSHRGPIPGHLHIEAFGDREVSLARTTAPFHRRSLKARKVHFSETLQVDPHQVRKIRVIHHRLSHKERRGIHHGVSYKPC